MNKITPTTVNYDLFGKAAALPGMILARDWLSAQIEALQREIQEGDEPPRKYQERTQDLDIPGQLVSLAGLTGKAREEATRHNQRIYARRAYQRRKGGMSRRESGAKGWAGMTAEERSREMKRRIAIARAKRGIENVRNAAKTRWDRMTRAQREAWKAKMQAGREHAQVNGVAS